MSESLILSSTVRSNEKLTDVSDLNAVEKEPAILPKPVVYARSLMIKPLIYNVDELSHTNTSHNSSSIAIKDITIEYIDDLMGIQGNLRMDSNIYSYSYLVTYVSIGIPTKRYEWFLKEAERLTKYNIKRNSSFDNGDTTWVVAAMMTKPKVPSCYLYSKDSNDIQSVGSLYDVMMKFKSNLTGVGHFYVSVYQSRGIKAYYLKFTLNDFQLIGKSDKTKPTIPFLKMEPPSSIADTLLNNK